MINIMHLISSDGWIYKCVNIYKYLGTITHNRTVRAFDLNSHILIDPLGIRVGIVLVRCINVMVAFYNGCVVIVESETLVILENATEH